MLITLEDWDLWLRCAIDGARFLYADFLPDTRALVRVHSRSLSCQSDAMSRGAAAVREKLAAIRPTSPRLQRAWDEAESTWHRRIEQTKHELATVMPDTGSLILIDEDVVLRGCDQRPLVLPVMERDGRYWGRPTDDADALREVARLKALGAVRVAFAFNTFWWLDCYHGLREDLGRRARPVHTSDVLKVTSHRVMAGARVIYDGRLADHVRPGGRPRARRMAGKHPSLGSHRVQGRGCPAPPSQLGVLPRSRTVPCCLPTTKALYE